MKKYANKTLLVMIAIIVICIIAIIYRVIDILSSTM
ncbi:cbb3-type cytochrome oxidase subunit 3 [Dysgonomonas hofstadii]|uniref:Cbb3-type cytochrome oxidase subunit 3 n=1 Tax=Dysgonomonas hofstadii TaxID=637886 RepID=A0A840CLW2_9BACT|nr:cbb3-type cytochrome oxidase subunit 3 [Dysgonomonas hofstadii]